MGFFITMNTQTSLFLVKRTYTGRPALENAYLGNVCYSAA